MKEEEYLELEREAFERHEFIDGEIYAMAGESLKHSWICSNINGIMWTQLRGTPCGPLSPNMKVKTRASGLFSYPDLSIVCGEPEFHDKYKDVLLNPTVIFEVLSPSTEKFDRGEKFIRYRNYLDSLTDYILISQEEPLVEHFSRQSDGSWNLITVQGLDKSLLIRNVQCELSLQDIYDRVEFDPAKEN